MASQLSFDSILVLSTVFEKIVLLDQVFSPRAVRLKDGRGQRTDELYISRTKADGRPIEFIHTGRKRTKILDRTSTSRTKTDSGRLKITKGRTKADADEVRPRCLKHFRLRLADYEKISTQQNDSYSNESYCMLVLLMMLNYEQFRFCSVLYRWLKITILELNKTLLIKYQTRSQLSLQMKLNSRKLFVSDP